MTARIILQIFRKMCNAYLRSLTDEDRRTAREAYSTDGARCIRLLEQIHQQLFEADIHEN